MKTSLSIVCLLLSAITSLAVRTSTAQAQIPSRLATIVEAERSFARASVQRGVRDSFLEFFAEDGINFKPEPANAKKSLRESEPTPPDKIVLNWEPVNADVSAAGDLGYTTGPFVLTVDGAPRRHGYYFSLWKRQPGGDWKVALDFGITTPAPADSASRPAFTEARPIKPVSMTRIDFAKTRDELMTAEKEFSRACKTEGAAKPYSKYLDPDARLHRGGVFPILGRDKIVAMLTRTQVSVGWEPAAVELSKSGDLGYTYGAYEATHGSSTEVIEKGYYTRVWRKDESGDWRVVADISNPLPKKQN